MLTLGLADLVQAGFEGDRNSMLYVSVVEVLTFRWVTAKIEVPR